MNLNKRLERVERLERRAAEKTEPTINIVLGSGWAVEIPASVYPEVMRKVDVIYGDHPAGEREERCAA
jgi:hypothetical protein